MNTDPITEAVVAALREAYKYGSTDTGENVYAIGHAATALLRDLARLQRPVAWVWSYRDGHRSLRFRPDHDPSSSDVPDNVAPLYLGLPGADAP